MTTPTRQIRWMACRNMHDTEAPPFALMSLYVTEGSASYRFAQAARDQQAVWEVTQPYKAGSGTPSSSSPDGLSVQDPSLFVCNGPTPIEPGGYGKCTQDWPARVRTDSAGGDNFCEVGLLCGPIANSWEPDPSGVAFTSLGYDPTSPFYGPLAAWDWERVNTLWISPRSSPASHQGKLTADLLYDDTTGVTVNIWTGTPLAESSPLRTIENVLPPLVMGSGQLDSGDAVTITRIDGKWYATNAPC